MSSTTWTILWTATLIVLEAMIEIRPLVGLSSALLLSLVVFMGHVASIAKRQGGTNV